MPSAGASEMFARFGKMRTDTSKKYGCIVVSDASKALEKSPLRRPLYVRPSNKDERRGLGVGRSKGWHKVAESRIKASMKPLKSENRIIKHNLEKSKQLISEENDQEEDENKSLEFHSPSPDPEICQVDGIPVQFGQQHSTSSTLGSAFQRQVELRANSSLDGFTKDSERPLHSPEYVGQDIVYHVFYQDNPLDIIESLLVARKSYDSSAKLEENEKQRSSEALVETLGKLSQRGDSTGADNLSTQESATLEQENSVGIEGTTSDRLLEGISEEIQVNLLDSKHAQVEETPRRHRFRASWDSVPAILKKQHKRIRAEEEGGLSKDLEAEDNQGGQLSDGETTISWNITSPEAENMEQSLLQLLNARLQVLSSHKLKYLLGVMDKLEGGDVDMLTPQEHPCEGVEVSAVSKTRTLSLRILSTWGDKHFVGLVQVDLFDTDGKKIDVQPMQITSTCEAAKEPSRIVDGGVNSSVWEALLPLPGSPPLEIFFQLPSEDTSIGHLEVWNHNQSIGKGVRDLQVLIDGEIAWQGTVSKSSGSQVYDSCTRIPLREGVTLPNPSIGKSISITPPSPKLEFEVSRLNSSSPKFEDSEVAGNKLATRQAVEKVETESIWSRAARYLQRSIASKREPQPEETDDADDNLQADIDKLEEDNMELEEIERILNSDGEDTCTFYNKFEQNVSQKVVSANLSADATYEMFSVDMLDESGDKAALLQALSYTDDADLEELDGDEQQMSELVAPSDFSIPLLPLGMKLTIDIHSSWGDPHYVGLSGIEIFDDAGQVVHIDSRKQISVSYTTAALLSGLNCSPCPVERLVDNVNLTCDDSHMWLAPFSPGHPCTITISLEGPTLLGMVRFWNYNKSTMHTYRGARLIRMFLDSQLIFYGELQRASGLLSDAYNNAEPILFTNNEASLCAIEMHDAQTYKKKGSPGSDGLHDMNEDTEAYIGSPLQNPVFKLPVPSSQGKRAGQSLHDHCGSDKAPVGRVLRLNLLRSWGDCYYFGLTGIQVLDENGNAHSIQSEFITGKPRDLNDIPGHTGDYRTLDKLVDGCNVTTDDRHMWLVPYDGPEAEHFLEIDFKRLVTMSALRFWNYNKSLDDTFRGVKWIQVLVDNVEVSPAGGFLLRKSPGTDKFDFGQVLTLYKRSKRNLQQLEKHNVRENAKQRRIYSKLVLQEYLTPLFPSGHVIKFVLLSTWGDHQYLGLNGIELFDELGQSIPVLKHNVHVLPDMTTHFSNPEKLFNGVNNTWDTQNMWLSVRDYTEGNQIYLYFNDPVMLSLVKIWNYSRNPTFGVREIEILVDDLLVYKGYVRKAIAANSRHLIDSEISPQSILFSSDEQTLRDNEDNVFYCGGVPNTDIILINDNYVVSDGSNALVTK